MDLAGLGRAGPGRLRRALGLDRENFYLFGHSWGGLLAIEYALKYPERLKDLIISNMMASAPAYNEYARSVLMPGMDQAARETRGERAGTEVRNQDAETTACTKA